MLRAIRITFIWTRSKIVPHLEASSVFLDGPTLCVICEYDALPEMGHACGHNLIAEAGFAAGVAVKRFMAENSTIKGKVTGTFSFDENEF